MTEEQIVEHIRDALEAHGFPAIVDVNEEGSRQVSFQQYHQDGTVEVVTVWMEIDIDRPKARGKETKLSTIEDRLWDVERRLYELDGKEAKA